VRVDDYGLAQLGVVGRAERPAGARRKRDASEHECGANRCRDDAEEAARGALMPGSATGAAADSGRLAF
jgi:hypothetical protein